MMNRRDFLRAAGAASCVSKLSSHAAMLPAKPRPNVVVILTDQQSSDVAGYRIGTQYLHTPNIDYLAANGTSFTRAYCADPICVASRTSMFTGRYPTETGVTDNDDLTKAPLDTRKFPIMGTIFERGGYDTAYFGKWHIACPEDQSNIHGFRTIATTLNDDKTANDAANYLQTKSRAPFLLIASFLNPHNICEWARGERLPLGAIGSPPPLNQCPPLRANHEVQHDEPDILALMRRSYQETPMFPVGDFSTQKWREYLWAYYRLVEKADAHIGIVLQALRDAGLEENTLVVFLADHGDCQGAHGWNQKTVFYEEASRVPLILSQRGVTRVGTAARLVNTGIDLIPTLCDYAGIEVPAALPGLSLKNSTLDPRRYVVVSNKMTQGAPVDGRLPTPNGRMVRGQRYKYCAYSEGKRRESLVDLKKDPGEMMNLAEDPRFEQIRDQHRLMLKEWCDQTHDSFPLPSS